MSYSAKVLINNWSEDRTKAGEPMPNDRVSHWETSQRANYAAPPPRTIESVLPMHIATASSPSILADRLAAATSSSLVAAAGGASRETLFAHQGAPTPGEQYRTTYESVTETKAVDEAEEVLESAPKSKGLLQRKQVF